LSGCDVHILDVHKYACGVAILPFARAGPLASKRGFRCYASKATANGGLAVCREEAQTRILLLAEMLPEQ
jgi:hypothetical protein